MNARNRKERLALPPCPTCGLDSGERVQSAAYPFLSYVRCTSCGASTLGFETRTLATKAWQRKEVQRCFTR